MPCKSCEERRKMLGAMVASLKGGDPHAALAKLHEFRRSLTPAALVEGDDVTAGEQPQAPE
jgi:hypothetical protein